MRPADALREWQSSQELLQPMLLPVRLLQRVRTTCLFVLYAVMRNLMLFRCFAVIAL